MSAKRDEMKREKSEKQKKRKKREERKTNVTLVTARTRAYQSLVAYRAGKISVPLLAEKSAPMIPLQGPWLESGLQWYQ